MEARSNCQLLVSLMLLSVFCSQTLAFPLETYSALSNGMLFDGPSEPNQNLGLLKVASDHLESSLPENDLSFWGAPKALIRKSRQFEKELNNLLQDDVFRKLIKSVLHELNNAKTGEANAAEKRDVDSVFMHLRNKVLTKEASGKD